MKLKHQNKKEWGTLEGGRARKGKKNAEKQIFISRECNASEISHLEHLFLFTKRKIMNESCLFFFNNEKLEIFILISKQSKGEKICKGDE